MLVTLCLVLGLMPVPVARAEETVNSVLSNYPTQYADLDLTKEHPLPLPLSRSIWQVWTDPGGHMSADGGTLKFIGYPDVPVMDLAYTEAYAFGFEELSFTFAPQTMNFHTFLEAGCLINGTLSSWDSTSGTGRYTGYALVLEQVESTAQLALYHIENWSINASSFSAGGSRTLLGVYKTGIQNLTTPRFNIQVKGIEGTNGGFRLYVDGALVAEIAQPLSTGSGSGSGSGFGFYTGYALHACPIITRINFTDVSIVVNQKPSSRTATAYFLGIFGNKQVAAAQTTQGYIWDRYKVSNIPQAIGGLSFQKATASRDPNAPALPEHKLNAMTYLYSGNEVYLWYSDLELTKQVNTGTEGAPSWNAGTEAAPLNTAAGATLPYRIAIKNQGGEDGEPPAVKQVASDPDVSLALTESGAVYGWGFYGTIGMADVSFVPTEVTALSNLAAAGDPVVQIEARSRGAMALTRSGAVYAWGYNYNGELGLGDTADRTTPTEVLALTALAAAGDPVVQLSLGMNHTLALTKNGKVYAWGNNLIGQLGLGDATDRNTPTEVTALTALAAAGDPVVQLAAGSNASFALTKSGAVYAWGYNYNGELGLGVNENLLTTPTPTEVPALTALAAAGDPVVQLSQALSLGIVHTLALTKNGKVYAWGNNLIGQLGLGDTTDRTTPTEVSALSNLAAAGDPVVQLSLGEYYTFALTKNGKVYAWGRNSNGELGLGDTTDRSTPEEVPALTALAAAGDPVVQLAEGDNTGFAMTENGALYAWGDNERGQLGVGDTTDRLTPTKVAFETTIPIELTDALPDGLTWADATLTITDENEADAASRFGTVTPAFDGKNLRVTVDKIPTGQFYLNLRVKVDDDVRGQKLTIPAAELVNENDTIPSNAVYLQSGIEYVTERYLCLGTDTPLKEDSLAAVAAGSPYGVDPTLLDDIVDADGATWRYYGYSVDGGATLAPATGAPTGYVHTDTSHALEEGGCPEVSHWNYAIGSVAEDSTHRVTYYFVKNVDLKISYREADTTNDVKTPFQASVGGGEEYVLSASHQESFVDEGDLSWSYANKYSMDGGTRVEEGKPPKALTPPLTEDRHVVLYFTKNPAVTVTLREYSDTAAGRKNAPMLFDRKTDGSSQEVYIITGDSLTPMDKTFVSGAIGSGVYNVSGRGYQYKGYSTDGGATFTEGNPAAMTGIAANTTLTLYFVTREATMPTLPDLGKEYDGSAVETPTVQATGENGAQVDLEYIWEKKTGDGTYTPLTTAPKDAGDYRVTAKVPDSNTDYVGETSKVFTITQKTVTITAKDKSVTIGGTVPSLASPTEGTDYTVAGLVAGDRLTTNPTLEYQKDGISATPNSTSAGTYAIVAKDANAGDNYTIVYAPGTLTVKNKTEATMPTLPDLGKEYDGSAVETLTDKATGENGAQVDLEYIWEKKNEDDTYTKLTTAPKDAGDYRVTAKVPDSNMDYVGETSKDFTITQKTVKITAKDKSVTVGGTVPSLASPTEGTDYTVEGLVTGDSLTTKPTLEYQKNSSTVTPNSTSAGTYDIVAKDANAGDNYTIVYAPGTLTVSSNPSSGGGSDGPTTYPPIIKDTDNGNVTVSLSRPARDDVVIIRPAPDKGYEVDDVVVTKPDGTKVPVKDRGDGTWSYIQPGVRVTVTVTFKRVADGTYDSCPRDTNCPIWPFKDASTTAWYHDGVHYCIDNGLMIGKSATRFDPNGIATRGEIVTILWRLEGQPKVEGDSYSDVLSGQYYTEAVVWAAANSIVTGYTDGTFKPDTPITREQMAAILWRYCKYKGIDVSVGEETNILSYNDATTVAEYAVSALQWAVGAGVIQGKEGNILEPAGTATRAQVATILMRFCVNIVKK